MRQRGNETQYLFEGAEVSDLYDRLPDCNNTTRCRACGGFYFDRIYVPSNAPKTGFFVATEGEYTKSYIKAVCKNCGAPHAEKLYMDSKK